MSEQTSFTVGELCTQIIHIFYHILPPLSMSPKKCMGIGNAPPKQTWREFLIELNLINSKGIPAPEFPERLLLDLPEYLDKPANDNTIRLVFMRASKKRKAAETLAQKEAEEAFKLWDKDKPGCGYFQNAFLQNPKYKERNVQIPYIGEKKRPRSVSFPTRLAVYTSICLHAYGKKVWSFPGIDTIARETGFDRTVVIRAIRDLEILGVIKKESRYNNKGRTSNGYILAQLE